MALVEVGLHSFLYRFRRLTWREEASVRPADDEDYRDAVLATALTDISGLKVTSLADARAVMRKIPRTIRTRFWVANSSLCVPETTRSPKRSQREMGEILKSMGIDPYGEARNA